MRCFIFEAVCIAGSVAIVVSATAQNVFVADFNGNIYEFTPSGVMSNFAGGLSWPVGIAFDKAGNLYVANSAPSVANIIKITPAGVQSTFATVSGRPFGVAVDSAGNVFVTDYQNGYVIKITPTGGQSTFAGGLQSPNGLAFDKMGNLFVADETAGVIYKYTPGGARSTFASGLAEPYGLAFDNAGNLFVAASGLAGHGSIVKITAGGVQSTFASGFDWLGDLTFDSAGDLFASDGFTGEITEFTPSGTRTIFASGAGDPIGLAIQPVPELQAISTNGLFEVTVSMPSPYFSTIIQSSSNLVNWVNVFTNTPSFTFTNSIATGSRCCFFRAVVGP